MLHHARGGNAGVAVGPCDEMTMGELLRARNRIVTWIKTRIAARGARAAIQCELG
jgi:hypothetical protein